MFKAYVFDLEADGYLDTATKIHCIAINELSSDVTTLYEPGRVDEALAILKNADLLIGHNITGYDIPLIRRLYPELFDDDLPELYDTLLASQLIYPNNLSMHSLDTWSKKLDGVRPKVEIEDFSKYTKDLGRRCIVDVIINAKLYGYLRPKEWFEFKDSMDTECKVALIHARQTLAGVRYDVEKAHEFLLALDKERYAIRKRLVDLGPRTIKKYGVTVAEPFTKAGKFKKMVGDWWMDTDIPTIRGPFDRIEYFPFNPDSSPQVIDFLKSLGWKPTEWNYVKDPDGTMRRTSPKLTEDSFSSIPPGLGEDIAKYRMLNHRRRMILNDKDPSKGQLALVRKDGRVPADAFTCGTPTFRYRHYGAVCNIPRPSSLLGNEIRELFRCEIGRILLGLDLKGIEARMLAHYIMFYTGGKELAEIIISKDYHEYNMRAWFSEKEIKSMGFSYCRNLAKSGLYALIYGCGPAKLAQTLGKPITQGRKLFNRFWKANAPVKELIDNLNTAYDSGMNIKTIGGRTLDIRQKRLILNTLLQGSAAEVFKKWMVKNDVTVKALRKFIYIEQVIAYHDELQYELDSLEGKDSIINHVTIANKLAHNAGLVGKELDIKVPIEVDYKHGATWRDTH